MGQTGNPAAGLGMGLWLERLGIARSEKAKSTPSFPWWGSWALADFTFACKYRQNSLVRYGFWRQMYRNTNGIVISRVTCRVNKQ